MHVDLPKLFLSRKKSFSTFAFSVSPVKISPSFSSVGIEEFEGYRI